MMRLTLHPLVLACFVAAAVPSVAYADASEDQAIARSLAGDGLDALKKNDFKTAEDRFRRAEQLLPDTPPTITANLARALKGQKRYVAAQEAYNRVIRRGKRAGDSAAFEKAIDDASTEKDEISKLIGTLTITVKGADKPVVSLDGQSVNAATLGVRRPIDPGQHEVKISAPGKVEVTRIVKVAEAGIATVDVELVSDLKAEPVAVAAPIVAPAPVVAPMNAIPPATPATPLAKTEVKAAAPAAATTPSPSAPSSSSVWSNPWFWTAATVGVAGAGLGVYAFTNAESIKSECTVNGRVNNKCANDKGYSTMQSLSLVGYGAAGAGFATALVIALWPSEPSAPVKGYRVLPVGGIDGTWGIRLDF